jgi:hypothetical protein
MQILNGSTPRIPVLLVDATDDETAETGLSPTVQLSKNGGTFATTTNTPVEVANGWYYVVLTATETNTDGPLLVRATGTGADEWRDYHQVYTTHATNVVSIAANAITASAIADNAIDAGAIASDAIAAAKIATGAFTAAKFASGALDAAALAADAANEIADALLDRSAGVETGLTPRQALRLIAAATAGKLSGAATATVTIRNAVADTDNRIVATVDADGNRSAITYDLT